MGMTDRPPQPPEGQLIATALKRMKMSQREAAKRAEISESRWRQIVNGYQTISGSHIPVRGPADTVARMAYVALVTPEQLEEAGRPDAAEELRQITPPPQEKTTISLAALAAIVERIADPEDESLQRVLELWPQIHKERRQALVNMLEAMLSEPDETGRKPVREDERRAM
jgi:transcriptional regulator with XRE-family HTH domain